MNTTLTDCFSEMTCPSDRSERFDVLKYSYDQNELLDFRECVFQKGNKRLAVSFDLTKFFVRGTGHKTPDLDKKN